MLGKILRVVATGYTDIGMNNPRRYCTLELLFMKLSRMVYSVAICVIQFPQSQIGLWLVAEILSMPELMAY